MEPMIVFVTGSLLARLSGWLGVDALATWPASLRVGLGLMFLLTASAHFVTPRRQGLIAMVPSGLPRADLLVTVTGALEVLGAVGLAVPGTYRAAAGCLAVLLLFLFPANVSAARRQVNLGSRRVTPIGVRTGMQVVWVAALLYAAFG
jgi:uncharacterized membrane protein